MNTDEKELNEAGAALATSLNELQARITKKLGAAVTCVGGQILQFSDNDGNGEPGEDDAVSIDGVAAPDGDYTSVGSGDTYTVKDGLVASIQTKDDAAASESEMSEREYRTLPLAETLQLKLNAMEEEKKKFREERTTKKAGYSDGSFNPGAALSIQSQVLKSKK